MLDASHPGRELLLPDLDSPLVWTSGGMQTARSVLSDAAALALHLPARAPVINACSRPETFLRVFLASLLRGSVTLLTTDRSERMTAALRLAHPDVCCVADEAIETSLPCVRIDQLALSPHTVAPPPQPAADQVAAIAFTSGSTGDPVGHAKSVGTLARHARNIAVQLRLAQGASLLATVPAQHMYGFEMAITLPLWAGVSVHAARPLYPGDIADALRSMPAPRVVVTTPLHLRALLESKGLPTVEVIVSASAPLPAELARAVERAMGARVVDLYGCTEAGTIATRDATADDVWTTCPGIRVQTGAHGYVVHGPHLPGPVQVNDAIEVLAPNRFRLRGRIDDLIKVAGRRTSVNALNAALAEIEGVVDGAFVAVESGGEGSRDRLIALVVAPSLSQAQIRDALKQRIDAALQPHRVHLVPSLPRAPTGKLPLPVLREMARKLGRRP